MEALLIHGHPPLCDDLLREIEREPISVVQPESIFTGQASIKVLINQTVQHLHSLIDGFGKALLFHMDQLCNHRALFIELWICIFIFIDYRIGDICQECMIDSQQAAMACRTAKQTAQYITTPFIGRHHPVADHKGRAANMVRDYAQRNILLFVLAVWNSCNTANMLHDILHRIHQEEVIHSLHNAGQALQPHARINIRMFHRRVVSLSIAVKLGKNHIPEFDIAVAFASNAASWLSTAILFAAVKIDLRTRSAGAGTMLPEIILFPHSYNALRCDANLFCPDVKRFIVVLINCNPELVHWQFQHLGAELPRPSRRLVFKIVAK